MGHARYSYPTPFLLAGGDNLLKAANMQSEALVKYSNTAGERRIGGVFISQ
jgi:hypothetical protein